MINIERICLSATKKHTRREYLLKEYSLQRLVWWNVEAIHRKTFINVFKTQRDKTPSWKLDSSCKQVCYTLDRSLVYHRTSTVMQTIIQSHTTPDVYGLWEEAGRPEEKPHKHGSTMQTPQKVPSQPVDLNPGPFWGKCLTK